MCWSLDGHKKLLIAIFGMEYLVNICKEHHIQRRGSVESLMERLEAQKAMSREIDKKFQYGDEIKERMGTSKKR